MTGLERLAVKWPEAIHDDRAEKLENLRIEVARWANERRGIRQSNLLEIYEARIFKALDALGPWREKDGSA